MEESKYSYEGKRSKEKLVGLYKLTKNTNNLIKKKKRFLFIYFIIIFLIQISLKVVHSSSSITLKIASIGGNISVFGLEDNFTKPDEVYINSSIQSEVKNKSR